MNENMGYKYEYKDGSKQFEHRRIAELKIGRKLRKGEIVHHIDGNKLNNNPDNLVVLSRADHGRIHQLTDAMIVELDDGETVIEPKLVQCASCGIYFHQYDARQCYCADCVKKYSPRQPRPIGVVFGVTSCPVCGKLFEKQRIDQKYCSHECMHVSQRRCNHPSKDDLAKLVWEIPTSQLAIQFNVSDKAIDKWCKQMNISKPPRGYWIKKKLGNYNKCGPMAELAETQST